MYFIHSHFLGRPLGHYPRPPPYPRSVLVHLFLGVGRIHVLLILIFFYLLLLRNLSSSCPPYPPSRPNLWCRFSNTLPTTLYNVHDPSNVHDRCFSKRKHLHVFLLGLPCFDLIISIISRSLLFVLQPFHNLEYPSDPWIVFWKISSFSTWANLLWQ